MEYTSIDKGSKAVSAWKRYCRNYHEGPFPALDAAVRRGELARMPVEFSRFMAMTGCAGAEDSLLVLAALLAASSLQNSHTCLILNGRGLKDAVEEAGVATLSEAFFQVAEAAGQPGGLGWDRLAGQMAEAVRSAPCCGRPGEERALVLDGIRLYLHRYWSYERVLADRLIGLSARKGPFSGLEEHDEAKALKAALETIDALFSKSADGARQEVDYQRLAAAGALFSCLMVVSGGPGTGKTWTVTSMMAAIQAGALAAGRPFRIALCAPTGKAAARLSQSVQSALSGGAIPEEVRLHLPREAKTIHRLLGLGRSPGRFRFHRGHPLPYDLVIVDEASMVDLPMMVHLTEALHEETGLILLGDKDQLASVEAGAVLHDICSGMEQFANSKAFFSLVEQAGIRLEKGAKEALSPHPLRDSMVQLIKNYRFLPGSGLSELASAVREGRAEEAARLLISDEPAAVRLITPEEEGLEEFIRREAGPWLEEILGQTGPVHAIKGLARLKVLCAVKHGPAGVEMVNGLMDRLLSERASRSGGAAVLAELADFSLRSTSRFRRETAHGRPVIITRNDYRLELFNGDTGICWPDEQGGIRVWFESDEGGLRAFSPARLPAFEPAWAITVHRSQGSEYDRVLVILPPEGSTMPGRELIYTAVTRARREVLIWGSLQTLKECILRKTRRHSGLSDLLWG